jgi:hypothetical protein
MINCDLKKNWNRKVCKKSVGEAHFTIIYPKADNSNNKINQTEFNKYVNKINSRFGGSTTKPITLGCWIDEKRNKLNCESGFAVETFRDFDSGMKKLNVIERKKQLEKDYKFLRKIAKDSAIDFGQDSIPVIFDNISDVSLNKGKWLKKINKSKLTGTKIKGDLWKKHI